MGTGDTRVMVVDDQAMVRYGFSLIVEHEAGLTVVGEAGDGQSAIDLARQVHPDIVLMDIRMPVLDGIAATATIRSDPDLAATQVIVLTTFDDDEYVFQALRAGAAGFLLKDVEPQTLVDAITKVTAGDSLLAPSITRKIIERFVTLEAGARGIGPRAADAPTGPVDRLSGTAEAAVRARLQRTRAELADATELLSDRESEIWQLVAAGMSNREIARTLVISETTVKSHVSALLAKLQVQSRVQAVILAYDYGLVSAAGQHEEAP